MIKTKRAEGILLCPECKNKLFEDIETQNHITSTQQHDEDPALMPYITKCASCSTQVMVIPNSAVWYEWPFWEDEDDWYNYVVFEDYSMSDEEAEDLMRLKILIRENRIKSVRLRDTSVGIRFIVGDE